MMFTYFYNGMELKINYSAKDFTASYNSDFGELEYSNHMMFMCPKVFTEELIKKEYCKDIASEFEKTLNFLRENPKFIENARSELTTQMSSLEQDLCALKNQKTQMKKLLKQGNISEAEYSQLCKKIKEKESEITKIKWEYFNKLKSDANIDINGIKKLISGDVL